MSSPISYERVAILGAVHRAKNTKHLITLLRPYQKDGEYHVFFEMFTHLLEGLKASKKDGFGLVKMAATLAGDVYLEDLKERKGLAMDTNALLKSFPELVGNWLVFEHFLRNSSVEAFCAFPF